MLLITHKREATGHNHRTSLPACTLLMLCNVGTLNGDIMRPDRRIFQRHHITYLTKADSLSISGPRTMRKNIALAGNTQHRNALLRPIDRVHTMLPETAGMWIVFMLMDQIASN